MAIKSVRYSSAWNGSQNIEKAESLKNTYRRPITNIEAIF